MNDGYVRLVEKEEMWARMLLEVLEDNAIPCTTLPVHGAGFSLKTGLQDSLQIFVPAAYLPQALELVDALFSAEILEEE